MLRTDTIPPRVPLREGISLLGGVEALVFDDGLAIPVSGYQRVRRDAHVSKKAKMAPIRRLEPENWPLPYLPPLRHFEAENAQGRGRRESSRVQAGGVALDFPLDLSIPQLTHEEDHGHRSLVRRHPGVLAFRVEAMVLSVLGSRDHFDQVEMLVSGDGLGAA